jgi:hypothetical protein
MGFFDKLFGKSAEPPVSTETKPQQNQTPCKTEGELLERFGGIALDRQLNFGEIIGTDGWNVDMVKEEISFGPSFAFPMQALGTISHSSQTWLWAWANTKSGLSESVIKQSLQLKKYGEDNGIELLKNSTFDFTKEDLHLIGIIASGMFNSSAYYIADYGQGAMVVTVKSDMVDEAFNNNPLLHLRTLTVIPQLLSRFDMNHKLAVINYLQAKGYSVNEGQNKIVGTKGSDSITAEFDDLSRLTTING